MRFYTIETEGKCLPAVSADGGKTAFLLKDLGVCSENLREFIEKDGQGALPEIERILKEKDDAGNILLSKVKLCAPIMYPGQDLICLGINYHEHAEEAERFSRESFGGERPYTIYFSKRVNRASAHEDPIPFYEGLVDSLDYEVELGVILGKDAFQVSKEEAGDCIFGYTIINDVSARNLQTRHKQWYFGKSLDGFTPMGPCIVTKDELDPKNLAISCEINEELRQNSTTGLMICSPEEAIAELSAGMTLKAGSIIATGTPSGVGLGFDPPKFLQPGDVVICRIEGIGVLRNRVEN